MREADDRTGENDGLDVVVLAQLPDKQLREVTRVDELPQRLARAAHDERRTVLCDHTSVCRKAQLTIATHS